jgi:hypothetical protein
MNLEIFQIGGLHGLADTILGDGRLADSGADGLRNFSKTLPYLILSEEMGAVIPCVLIGPKLSLF